MKPPSDRKRYVRATKTVTKVSIFVFLFLKKQKILAAEKKTPSGQQEALDRPSLKQSDSFPVV